MNTYEISHKILSELEISIRSIDPEETKVIIDAIINSKSVFVAGAGRSLLMMRALAMRLMQIGIRAYVVGETVTPAINPDDLLIVGSGSGETKTLKVIVNNAKNAGATVGLITLDPDSSIGKMADLIVKISASSTKVNKDIGVETFQPGGNLFEQSLLIICDSIVISLIKKIDLQDPNKLLMRNHANLE